MHLPGPALARLRCPLATAILVLAFLGAAGCDTGDGPADDDSAGPGDDDASSEVPPPTVDPLSSPTREVSVTVTGTAQPGFGVQVQGGMATVEAAVAGNGSYAVPVSLVTNAVNHLLVRAYDEDRRFSDPVAVVVEQDSMPPSPPDVDPIPDQTAALTLTLTGFTESGALVQVDGGASPGSTLADPTGAFEVAFDLYAMAMNHFDVTATDLAGNTSLPTSLSIEQVSGPAMPVLYPVDSPTHENPVHVTGVAGPQLTIRVEGGVGAAVGSSGITGGFNVPVDLFENAVNELSVVAIDDIGLESPPATLTVVHDGIPPDPPWVDPVPDIVGDLALTLTGTTEPDATVTATIGAANFTGPADGAGAFLLPVSLIADSANTISVRATDEAGNQSGPTVLDVVHDAAGPHAPTLNAIPSPTNLNPVTVTGYAEAHTTLHIEGGAATASVPVGPSGTFSLDVTLNANVSNTLRAYAVDDAANAGPQVTAVVVHDDLAPSSPVLNPVSSPTTLPYQTVSGLAEAGSVLVVLGGASVASTVSISGTFSVLVNLNDGTNDLEITAEDEAGNVSAPALATIVVDATPPPLTVNPVSSPTRFPSQWVTGTTEPGAFVQIAGLPTPTSVYADGGGVWSSLVTLAENASNNLSITARDSLGNTSAPLVVQIVHDDTPPGPPELDEVDTPTPVPDVVFTGVTESEGSVRITDETGSLVEEMLDLESGEFASSAIALMHNTTNVFVFVAIDAAGNQSDPLDVTIVHDDIAPAAPTLNAVTTPTSLSTQAVSGATEPEATVRLYRNGTLHATTTAGGSGSFSITVSLVTNSTNTIEVYATDGAGNESPPAGATIVHDSGVPSAPLVNAVPSPTSLNPVTVSGRTEAGATVYVSGGAFLATTGSDIYGNFSVSVYLNSNTTNYLTVTAVDGAGNVSGATYLTVVHDSIAPSAPVLDPVDYWTNDLTATAHGYAEPSSLVSADFGGGATGTQFAAAGSGEFSWTRALSAGTTYSWSFRSQDAAGNTSSASTMNFATCSTRDTYEDTGRGDSCTDPIDLGSVDDRSGNIVYAAGNLLPASDADWYKIYVQDNHSTDQSSYYDYFDLKVSFSVNEGSAYKFDVFRGGCDNAFLQCGTSHFTSYELANYGSCNYVAAGVRSNCEENSGYWYIQVVRTDGGSDCKRYELKITAKAGL